MDYRDYSKRLQDIGAKYIAGGYGAWEGYIQAIDNESKGEFNVEDVPKKFMNFVQTGGIDTLMKLMKNNLAYYAASMNASIDFANYMIDSIYIKTSKQTNRESDNLNVSMSARAAENYNNIDLEFSGKVSELQHKAFVIANKQASDIEVSFEISELISEDGKTRLPVNVSFEPDHFLLKQNEEQVINCKLDLDDSLKPGQQYVAIARVVGFESLWLRLIVNPVP